MATATMATSAAIRRSRIPDSTTMVVVTTSSTMATPRAGSVTTSAISGLLQILAGDLRQPFPEHDIVPLGAVLPVAVFVLVALVGGQGEFRHRLALRRVLDFGILAQVSNQNDFVYAFHECKLIQIGRAHV